MKRFSALSLVVLLSMSAHAQEKSSISGNQSPPSAGAAATAPEEVRIRALEEQVRTLAEEVALLRGELKTIRDTRSTDPTTGSRLLLASARIDPGVLPSSTPSTAAPTPAPEPNPASPAAQIAQTQTYGGATSNAKLLNPDISLIGDFIGTAGRNTISPSRSLELHESEVGMQAIIDPYARADAFISFGEEDGIDDAGISLSRFLPAPKNWFFQGTAQVYRGDSSDVFSANRRQDVSVVGHLRIYRDLGASTNLDLGASYARGHNNAAVGTTLNPSLFLTNLYSADATLRWKPLRRAIYHSFLFRTELFWSARDQLSPLNIFQTQHAFGMYSDSEYRVNRRWTLGGRFDRSGRATSASLTDTGFSGILTYWPSEFSQIRGQYRYGHLWDVP